MNIPVADVQQQLNDELYNKIEHLNCLLEDQRHKLETQEKSNRDLRSVIAKSEERILDKNNLIATYQVEINERSFAIARATSLESQVKKLEADLKTEVDNRDHFRHLVAQQDSFIKEAKRQIEEFKRKKEEELKTKTNEAEHLARQVLKLKEENDKYRGSEYTDLKKVNDQLNAQTPLLVEENRKFKEQTTRLIEEKRKLEDKLNQLECRGCHTGEMGEYCGGCLGCLTRQAEHNMSLTHKDYLTERKINEYSNILIEVLVETIDTMKSMPCITWRKQAKVYHDCKRTIADINAQIKNIRSNQNKESVCETKP